MRSRVDTSKMWNSADTADRRPTSAKPSCIMKTRKPSLATNQKLTACSRNDGQAWDFLKEGHLLSSLKGPYIRDWPRGSGDESVDSLVEAW